MRDYFEEQRLAAQEREFAPILRLLRKAFGPKPKLLLTKSIVAAKRKPLRPSKPILVVPNKVPTDRELLGGLSDAVARGWLSGHDALAAERLVQSGKPLPKAVRDVILGRRGR